MKSNLKATAERLGFSTEISFSHVITYLLRMKILLLPIQQLLLTNDKDKGQNPLHCAKVTSLPVTKRSMIW